MEMDLFSFAKCAAWLGFRQVRRFYFSVQGRNSFASPPLSVEWRSVTGLHRARQYDVRTLRQDEGGNTLWQTPLGEMWTPPGMSRHFVQMIAAEMLSGVYDLENLPQDAVVIDAGANVGFFSRLALQRGVSKIVAFEPSPQTAACLRRNLSQWLDSGEAVIVEKGLWNEETEQRFAASNADNPGAHHISDKGEVVIRTIALDDCAAELGVPRVDYIKMDIEGAEQNALGGAAHVLRRDKPTCAIAVEHTDDMMKNALAVSALMRAADPGYACLATEQHPYTSPSLGSVLCPYTLIFRNDSKGIKTSGQASGK